jgi:hypothetical protein
MLRTDCSIFETDEPYYSNGPGEPIGFYFDLLKIINKILPLTRGMDVCTAKHYLTCKFEG